MREKGNPKMRRVVALLAALSLALLVMGTALAEEVKITYWGVWGGWFAKEVEQVVIDEFNKKYDGLYEVEGVEIDVLQKLPVAVAGGAPPGVVKVDRFRVGSYAVKGLLQELDNLIARDDVDLANFYPATVAESNFQGKYYALPWNTDDRALFYNVTLFNKAGLDPEHPPRTWEELDRMSLKLDEYNSDGQLVQAGLFPHYGNWYFVGWLWAAGGRLLDETGRKVAWDSPEGRKALTWMADYIDRYGGQGAIDYCWSLGGFNNGSVAMHMEGSWNPGHLNDAVPDLDWRVADPPRPAELADEPVTWSGGFALGIPTGVTGKEKEAAWAFIKFYTSHWAQKHLGVVSKGQIPALRSAATSDEFLNCQPGMPTFVRLMEYTKFRPVSPFGKELWSIYTDEVHALLRAGEKTPVDILQSTAQKAQAVLDEGWAALER